MVIAADTGVVVPLSDPLVSGIGAKGCLPFSSKDVESTGFGLRSAMMLAFLAHAFGIDINGVRPSSGRNKPLPPRRGDVSVITTLHAHHWHG
jgi:hypothetical protein